MKNLLFIIPIVLISCVKEVKLDLENTEKYLVLESVSFENENITASISTADHILNPTTNISDILQNGEFILTRLTDNFSVNPDTVIIDGARNILVFPMTAEKGHLYKISAESPGYPKVEVYSGEIKNAMTVELVHVDSVENNRSTNQYGVTADSSYIFRLKINDLLGITGNSLRLFADVENTKTENGFTTTENLSFQPILGELYTKDLFFLNFSKPFSYLPETTKLNFYTTILYDQSYDGGAQIIDIKALKNGASNLKTDCCLTFYTQIFYNYIAVFGSADTKSIEYLFSVYQNYYSYQNQFSTPSQVKNNAQNGYGTFAIFSQTAVELKW